VSGYNSIGSKASPSDINIFSFGHFSFGHFPVTFLLWTFPRNRNRNVRPYRVLLKSQAQPGTNLFTSAGVFQRLVDGELRSDFQIVRGDRVSVKVGVV